jgi:voltage-gated potassium channel
MRQSIKSRVCNVLELADPGDRTAEAVNFFLMMLVVLNVIAVVLETVENVYRAYFSVFHALGDLSIIVFSAEYLLRVWSCDANEKYRSPLGRLRFMLMPLVLIDLMVILPIYLSYVFPDHRFLRSLRLLWTFRLLKLSRYSKSLRTILDVLRSQDKELAVSFTAIIFFLVLSSTVVYFLEHDAQPQNFPNIPATMWWAILTMTTIGESVYPVTTLGKIIGGLIIILGVATFALSTAILTSGFVEELDKIRVEEEEIKMCPHCGKTVKKDEDQA